MRMEQVLTDKKQRMPSSRVLEEVIDQAAADYFTVGWLTSILQQRSFASSCCFLDLDIVADKLSDIGRYANSLGEKLSRNFEIGNNQGKDQVAPEGDQRHP